MDEYLSPREVVQAFFEHVRSGRQPERAHDLMANQVLAHQVQSENARTIERTPQNYIDHVQEMIDAYGTFELTVQEMIAEQDRVYVRWRQVGTHRGQIDEFTPTGLPVVEIASAVYRVRDGKIVEYWIQIDRAGLLVQLKQNAALADGAKP